MVARYFTPEEANALLPTIEPLMDQLMRRRAHVVESRELIGDILKSGQSDFGGAEASEVVRDFIAIERLARKIRSHGCIIKDLNVGLVDFLSKRKGREVYLCWRHGEAQVAHYHELNKGFSGRRRI